MAAYYVTLMIETGGEGGEVVPVEQAVRDFASGQQWQIVSLTVTDADDGK
jgi:hypothetical protein